VTLRRWLLGLATGSSLSCSGPGPTPGEPGPACEALLAAARRAEACDPSVTALADDIATSPDEPSCRAAARALIATPTDRAARLRSLGEPVPSPDLSPLSGTERRALLELPLPARLELVPDLRPGPGVPPTTVEVDGTFLRANEAGVLRGDAAPGARTLRLRHAGRESIYCLELRACETMRVATHGARLARHPQVEPGPC
jgi:hypothetical protein